MSGPTVSRAWNSNFERIRVAERLKSQRRVMDKLREEYEWFDAFPAGYSQLRLGYAAHLDVLEEQFARGLRSVSDYMVQSYVNNFLMKRGVKDPRALRRDYGHYAARKLAPMDYAFGESVRAAIIQRGEKTGLLKQAHEVARHVVPRLAAMAPTVAPLDYRLDHVYRNSVECLASDGLTGCVPLHAVRRIDGL